MRRGLSIQNGMAIARDHRNIHQSHSAPSINVESMTVYASRLTKEPTNSELQKMQKE